MPALRSQAGRCGIPLSVVSGRCIHGAFDDVFELSNVSRKVIELEFRQGFGVICFRPLSMASTSSGMSSSRFLSGGT